MCETREHVSVGSIEECGSALEYLYTHLDEVEQTAPDDGDTLGPHIAALIVDGSVPSPQTGRIQNLIHAFAQGAVVKRVPRKWHPLRRA